LCSTRNLLYPGRSLLKPFWVHWNKLITNRAKQNNKRPIQIR
jgi:hypothetical protein